MVEAKKAYSVAEVSKLLGIAKCRVYPLIHSGDLPSIRITPNRIIIPATALDRWLEEKAAGSKAV